MAEDTKAEIVLITGMHRSGTSALTRVCNLLGGALPEPLVEPAVGNELGHWEPAEVVAMNDRALLDAHSDVNSIHPLSPAWLRSKAAQAFSGGVRDYVGRLCEEPRTWFIKDPRISVLSSLWREGVEAAGAEPKVIIAFRNPWEVAHSLAKRQLHHFPDEVWPIERGLALWLNYVVTVEHRTRGLRRSFVNYADLLTDWRGEIPRIYSQLHLPEPDLSAGAEAVSAFLNADEQHVRQDAPRSGPFAQVFQLLKERVQNPAGGSGAFDKARRAYQGAFEQVGGYLDALEARARDLAAMRRLADRAAEDVERYRLAAEDGELRLSNLVRVYEARLDAAPVATEAGDDPLLAAKFKALKQAHQRNVDAFQAADEAWRLELESLKQAAAAQLLDALQEKDAAHRDALEAVERSAERREEERSAAIAQGASSPHDGGLGPNRVGLEQEIEEGRRAYEDLRLEAEDLRAALQRSDGGESEARVGDQDRAAEAFGRERLLQEIQDGRAAYEDLRLEAAALRAEVTRLAGADSRSQQQAADIDWLQNELNLHRQQLAIMQQSRSWRLTQPLRSLAARRGDG